MKYKREDIITAIIDMRTKKGLSNKSIVEEFLRGQLGYKQSYAYTLLKEAREKISLIYKSNNESSINEAVAQLEELYEKCMRDKNTKQALEVRKELNKLLGLYSAEKIDITSGGDKITEIRLIQVNKKDE
jgi:hypothetical protein